MRVEIDQSGRLEQSGITVLAFSDDISKVLAIPGPVKSDCMNVLLPLEQARRRRRGKPEEISKLTARLKILAVSLFLLLKDHLTELKQISIDNEYEGHEAAIKGILLEQIRKAVPGFSKERITIQRIGKESSAHHKAHAVYRGERQPDIKIKRAEEILQYLL